MLVDLNFEDYYIKYNKFPKTKYSLYINSVIKYAFTSTSKSEEECLEILESKAKSFNFMDDFSYKIYSERDGVKTLLGKGRIK